MNTDGNINRIYQIVRIHEGVATVIDGTYDPATGEFTFITDEFSIYTIIYHDQPIAQPSAMDEVPQTGEGYGVSMIMAAIAAVLCGSYLFTRKKQK